MSDSETNNSSDKKCNGSTHSKTATILNNASVALALSIAYRTKLLDFLGEMAKSGTSSTVTEIAASAGLNRRYVKELLAVLVCDKLVDAEPDHSNAQHFDDEDGTVYSVKEENCHSMQSIGKYCHEIQILSKKADTIVEHVKNGGGIAGCDHEEMQEWMGDSYCPDKLISQFIPSVPDLVEKLTSGISVCDVGCGRGSAVMAIAQAFPNSEITGIDIDTETIQEARHKAEELGLTNVEFHVCDISCKDDKENDQSSKNSDKSNSDNSDKKNTWKGELFEKKFDYVTCFDVVHDSAHPNELLSGMYKIIAPGGKLSLVEIKADSHVCQNRDNIELSPFLYTVSLFYCMTVSLAQDGVGVGMMWGSEKVRAFAEQAGFQPSNIMEIGMDFDSFNMHFLLSKNK